MCSCVLPCQLPNLAGLSRTCEIFHAERLMLSDPSVVHESDFQSISVTAHKWLPIEALAVANIAAFIKDRQQEGYTCIALEQVKHQRRDTHACAALF